MAKAYTVKALMDQLRAGEFTFPGGYPCFFVLADGEALSFDAVKDNLLQCARATRNHGKKPFCSDKQWAIVGCEINYEDPALRCAHTGKLIESAYGGVDES